MKGPEGKALPAYPAEGLSQLRVVKECQGLQRCMRGHRVCTSVCTERPRIRICKGRACEVLRFIPLPMMSAMYYGTGFEWLQVHGCYEPPQYVIGAGEFASPECVCLSLPSCCSAHSGRQTNFLIDTCCSRCAMLGAEGVHYRRGSPVGIVGDSWGFYCTLPWFDLSAVNYSLWLHFSTSRVQRAVLVKLLEPE